MKIAFITLSLLWVSLFAVRCAGEDRAQVSVMPASERAIITAMGQGLLGAAFDSMTPDERRRALEAEYRSLEYAKAGEVVTWSSRNNAASGSVIPGQPYRVGSQNCRQYSHSFIIGGVPRTARGSACRNPDGSWAPLT